MANDKFEYIIIGGGVAGGTAVEGIREVDPVGPILLLTAEKHIPYERPPLSKGLWSGKKKLADLFIHDSHFYDVNNCQLKIGTEVVSIDSKAKTIRDSNGGFYQYNKLLIATGGHPRKLPVDDGSIEGVSYYRNITDFGLLSPLVKPRATATVIGGGFIGTEMAAALNMSKVDVNMVFADKSFTPNVFPDDLGNALMKFYEDKGIQIHADHEIKAISGGREKYIVDTNRGLHLESDILIVGIGIEPETALANSAGLTVGNGIEVNELLQTPDPVIFAAGDNANFPYQVLGKRMRVEHWDNGVQQGKLAGRNMAGAAEPYSYMPYFYSDLFEFGYEAVGDVSTKLETFEDWQDPFKKGVIYYLENNQVRGIMTCNVWDRLPIARKMIKDGIKLTKDDLRGAIK